MCLNEVTMSYQEYYWFFALNYRSNNDNKKQGVLRNKNIQIRSVFSGKPRKIDESDLTKKEYWFSKKIH